jgi:hypothetical protein
MTSAEAPCIVEAEAERLPQRQKLGIEVLRCPIGNLGGAQVDISVRATRNRYRLVDCGLYAHHGILSIREFTSLAQIQYAAISYIWKAYAVTSIPDGHEVKSASALKFAALGAEDGDPINSLVLNDTCKVALEEGTDMLWLDCLCIIQTDPEDKSWQIKHMYDIYRNSTVCIVLPGGLSKLLSIENESRWITRAWTLQEVIAPPKTVVVFSWLYGSGNWEGYEGAAEGHLTEVTCGISASMPLQELLNACQYPQALTWTPNDGTESRDDISPCILGQYGSSSVGALMWALNAKDPEERSMALWQSSLMRTSSRPVDMIFSIMGAFNVILEPRLFKKHDRIRATIALAQAILRQGGKPVWIGISLDIPPNPFISSFPDFPITDVTGSIRWTTQQEFVVPNVPDDIYDIDSLNESTDDSQSESDGRDISSVLLPDYWLTDLPSGSMDDDGYLTISAKATRIYPTGLISGRRRTRLVQNNDGTAAEEFTSAHSHALRIAGTDGRIWDIRDTPAGNLTSDIEIGLNTLVGSSDILAYVVVIGTSKRFPRDRIFEPDPRPIGGIRLPEMSAIRAYAIEQHKPGKFHRSSTFLLDNERFQPIISKWTESSFLIGGPNDLPEVS